MNDIIKMIGLDLDGTVLTTDKKMTPYTREVLQKAIEAGVVVLPATGRPISAISKEFLDIPGVRYALTNLGSGYRASPCREYAAQGEGRTVTGLIVRL